MIKFNNCTTCTYLPVKAACDCGASMYQNLETTFHLHQITRFPIEASETLMFILA